MTVQVDPPRVEHLRGGLGIGTARPRLSWITRSDIEGWRQAAYELHVHDDAGRELWSSGRVPSPEQVLVAWGGAPLPSRTRAVARVRVWGEDGSSSEWSPTVCFEVGLLEPADWRARFISEGREEPPGPGRPARRFRRDLTLPWPIRRARLYVTALGVYQATINGRPVCDEVLAPGWTSFDHRLVYRTADVTDLLSQGENELAVTVADGWYRGRLASRSECYGSRTAVLAQLEVELEDGSVVTVVSDDEWTVSAGPILSADLYDGEHVDARVGYDEPAPAVLLDRSLPHLVAPTGPPVRRTEELAVHAVLTSPSGATLLDFGQNLTGWVRLTVDGPRGTQVVLRHAEVLEHGELCTRTLRSAKATDTYVLAGGGPETWEPSFTFHGFRYVEVSGWPGRPDPASFRAVVVHSDLERTGTFTCSDPLLVQLHSNIVWSMRGNVLSIPTDCPQRDERLGWTGDMVAFAATAAFLYDCTGLLSSWLTDLALDQHEDGTVPFVVPEAPLGRTLPAAGWGDAATVVPMALHLASGDLGLVAAQYDSMRRWVDRLVELCGPTRLWDDGFQFGDWLDPTAPVDQPQSSRTDKGLIATAWVVRSARLLASAADLLGKEQDAHAYARFADEVAEAFRREYATVTGRVVSESQTAYALVLQHGLLLDPDVRTRAGRRLAELVWESGHTVATGFLGTPIICDALVAAGYERDAFLLLTGPSWLAPVRQGATTMWERWDAMLPDGTVNGDGMTSFNHCALGSVGDWLHRHVGGLVPMAPGYARSRIAPHPGGGLTHATTRLLTPYGELACSWRLEASRVTLDVRVPTNTDAVVVLPGIDARYAVGSGCHSWSYDVSPEVIRGWAKPTFGPAHTIAELYTHPAAWDAFTTALPDLAEHYREHPPVDAVTLAEVLAYFQVSPAVRGRLGAELAVLNP